MRWAIFVIMGSAFLFPRLWATQSIPQMNKPWHSVNKFDEYVLHASGDVLSEDGADVSVKSINGDSSGSGGAAQSMDGTSVRRKTVTLSGVAAVEGGAGTVSFWIRADAGEAHLAFSNKIISTVKQSKVTERDEVTMVVPSATTQLVYGIYVRGRGSVGVSHLRLTFKDLSGLAADTTPEAMLDSAFKIVKENALNTDKVDWATVEADTESIASSAKIAADTYPAIKKLLVMLGDSHSSLISPYEASSLEFGGQDSSTAMVKLIEGDVGYIGMPGYRGFDTDAGRRFAAGVQMHINDVSSNAKKGWVVDLREDSGGNMWPMLAALESFLGGDKIGSFVAPGNKTSDWHAGQGVPMDQPRTYGLLGSPVAVLIGPRTNSSGEAVTVAFQRRPLTKFFGQATSGRSTSNKEFRLPDGSMINLTTAVDADRTGRLFGGKIIPDVVVSYDDLTDDSALHAALNWLDQVSRTDSSAK